MIEKKEQGNAKRVEALPLALEKLEDERKDPLEKLKKVNLPINGEEKATFITEDLEE